MKRKKILLDTDMGSDVDDALCLGLALTMPELELIGVTTVAGDTACRSRVARKLLDLAGRPDIPVFTGSREPLSGEDRFFAHGAEGVGILEEGELLAVQKEEAVPALARLLGEHPEAEVVAIGPLTNLAHLIRDFPETAAQIPRLTIMGGHLREIRFGEKAFPFGIDYNLCSDPEATEIVLHADIPTRLVTADVTMRTWLTVGDRDRLAATDAPALGAIVRALDLWTPVQCSLFERHIGSLRDNVAFLHDPLALVAAVDESFCTFDDLHILPAWREGIFRTLEDPSGRKIRCARSVESERFREFFVDRLLRLGQPGTAASSSSTDGGLRRP
jgi:inosine-uridine nucleoside N-ribohydrolase